MNQEFLENIEAYLEGNLDRETLETLAKDAGIKNLEEEIQWVKDVQLAVNAHALRDQLNIALPKNEVKSTPTAKVRSFRIVWAAAAAIAVIIIGYFGFFRSDSGDLYAQYKIQEPGIPVVMGETDQYELQQAFTYYGEDNFEEAISRFEALDNKKVGSDTVQYYLGLSLLYNDEAKEAIPYFEKVGEDQNSVFNQKADWFTVLSYLQIGDYDQANASLKPVLDNANHAFYEEALSLKQALENR